MNNFYLIILVSCVQVGNVWLAVIRESKHIDDIIDLDHDYLTYNHYIDDGERDTTQYHFRSDKSGSYVPLHRNPDIDLNVPMCSVEGENVVCKYGTEKKTHFYQDADHSVAVAIANENGTMKLQGVIHHPNTTHEFMPLDDEQLPSNRYHVIKKRWTANIVRKAKRVYIRTKRGAKKNRGNKTKKNKKNTRVSKYKPFPPTKSPYKNRYRQYIPPTTPGYKPPASSDYCVDVLVVVDYSIYKKFGGSEKKIRYYYAHVVNGINMRYAKIAQSNLKITVRLAGYFIAKRATDLNFVNLKKKDSETNNYTLTKLDAFLKSKQKGTRSVLPDFNHAMLFLEYEKTNVGGSVLDLNDDHIDKEKYEFAFEHGEPEDGVSGDDGGTSFVSGICSDSKSTSLVVDHGAYTSAGIGTHELGHNLGVFFHDGEGDARQSSCSAKDNYIMAPASYLIDKNNLRTSFSFSPCSLVQIQTHISNLIQANRNCLACSERRRTSYLDQKEVADFNNNLKILPGTKESVHEQCKQLYGDQSFMCPPSAAGELCYRMYCYDPSQKACAIISEQMAAPGTPCGYNKVCKLGACVYDAVIGKNVSDDCPYPDIPSSEVHCEDANDMRCADQSFKKKCCTSCSKKFTDEDNCKDQHIKINGNTCTELMNTIFRTMCDSSRDNDVKKICCRSCRGVTDKKPTLNKGYNPISSRGGSYGRQPTNARQPACQDNPGVKINGLTCSQLINTSTSGYCKLQPVVRDNCCGTCSKYNK